MLEGWSRPLFDSLANLRDKSRLTCYIPEGVEEITRLGSDFLLGFCSGKNVGH